MMSRFVWAYILLGLNEATKANATKANPLSALTKSKLTGAMDLTNDWVAYKGGHFFIPIVAKSLAPGTDDDDDDHSCITLCL